MRLRWFGHRSGCPAPFVPAYRGPDGLVCASCMPELVPRCPLCGEDAARIGVESGFVHYAFGGICPTCVARVRRAGPWKIRRALALEARVEALCARFPEIHVVETAPRRVSLGGTIAGRAVSCTLKIAARWDEDERYVLRVELHTPITSVTRDQLRLEPKLVAMLARHPRESPTVVFDRHRWLRAAFRHLGKLDVVDALEGLLATAEELDRRR